MRQASRPFCTLAVGTGQKKEPPPVSLRVEADTGEGWRVLSRLHCTGDTREERMAVIPVWPHRTDRVRLRLSGLDPCGVLSLAREYRSESIYG